MMTTSNNFHRTTDILHDCLFRLAGVLLFVISFIAVTTPAIAQQQPLEIKLRLGDVSLNKLPFILAYDAGIYKKNGIDVLPMFTQSSVKIIRRSGIEVPEQFILNDEDEAPICICGSSPTVVRTTTRAGAWDPINIGSTHLTSRWRIVAGDDITSVDQLKGKRIGYSGVGAVSHLESILFARHMGWNPNLDISLMSDALALEALQKGYVDAFMADELHETMAVKAGYKIIADMGDYKLPVAGSAFAVDREWLKKNQDAARRFIKSTVEAIALLKTDKQATFKTLTKWYQITDPETLEYFYAKTALIPAKPYNPVAGLKTVMEVYDSHEMRKYTVEHFYDDSFVRELDESGYIDSLYKR
jgi:NitT/TauT family transport system substrate-binding protein